MRVKNMQVDPELLLDLFHRGATSDLPKDVEIVFAGFDTFRGCIVLTLKSGEYEDVADMRSIPVITPTFKTKPEEKRFMDEIAKEDANALPPL